MKHGIHVAAIIALMGCGGSAASALTAEVAKNCRAQAIKAYPTAIAGSRSTAAEQQRQVFKACVEQAENSGQAQPNTNEQKK